MIEIHQMLATSSIRLEQITIVCGNNGIGGKVLAYDFKRNIQNQWFVDVKI